MDLAPLHLAFAWIWMSCGVLSGTAAGLVFHREHALGGYASWTRRLVRLGHIAFFGTALINVSFACTLRAVPLSQDTLLSAASISLIAGSVAMPVTCYLAAWRSGFRHLFVVPVVCLAIGVIGTAVLTVQSLVS